jgi:hypothetical protein
VSIPVPSPVQLRVTLSETWSVADPAAWSEQVEFAHLAGIADRADAISHVSRPDLLASLFEPVGQPDQPFAVVIATLAAWSYPRHAVPMIPPGALDGHVLTGIEISPGVRADFYARTFVVSSDETDTTAFLTFSTPNLPLHEAMDAAFESIADTAVLERA